MKKPIKPKKPSKNLAPPSPEHWIKACPVAVDNNGKLFIAEEDDDNLDLFYAYKMTKAELDRLHALVEYISRKESTIDVVVEVCEDDLSVWLNLKVSKDPAIYNQELEDYNNREQKYQDDLVSYEKNLKEWEAEQKRNKIKKLEAEINKLKTHD